MVRERINALGTWIDNQSAVVRVIAFLGGLIAFRVVQMATYVVETMGDVGIILVGTPVIVVGLLSLYVMFVVVRSFWRDWQRTRPAA